MSKAERAAYMRDYNRKNREAINARRRELYAQNPERVLERNGNWRRRNPDSRAESNRRDYEKNGNVRRAKRMEYHRRKLKEPGYREKLRAYQRAWRAKNRKKERQRSKEYRTKHSKQCYESSRRSIEKNPLYYRQKNRLRAAEVKDRGRYDAAEWLAILARWGSRCARCGTDKRIDIDHVRSIKQGGMNVASNLQPLCRRCNAHKGTRFMRFLPIVMA